MAKKAYIGVDSKARKVKKGYIGVENFVPRALPSGYTQLSHIEATGAQHFDSGVVPAENLRLELAFIPSETGQTDNAMFGASWSNDGFLLTAYKGNVRFHSKGYYIDLTKDASGINTMSCSQTSVTINGVSHAMTGTGSDTQAHTIYLFWVGDQSSPNNKGHYKLLYCKMYAGETLIRDYVPSKNANGVVGLYDMVNNTFGGSATSSAFVAGSSAPSVAHKIKKAYIGIGGVARPCWSGGELAYYGTITSLSVARNLLAATTIGNYALFGGGSTSNYSGNVDAYNTSLTRTSATALGTSRASLAATTVGNYAMFGGGDTSSNYSSAVDAYNASLTKASVSKRLYNTSCNLAATTVGNYALFGGGYGSNNYELLTNMNAYDTSLARTTPTGLSVARRFLAATTIGSYALFGGGGEGKKDTVDAYDASLVRTTPAALSAARQWLAATTVGGYALFGGGEYSATVDAYNTSLTRTIATTLSTQRGYLAATTVGDYALFGGGGKTASSVVDAYDASLTRTTPTGLNTDRYQLEATTVGNYALFGGGYTGMQKSAVVDAYIVA